MLSNVVSWECNAVWLFDNVKYFAKEKTKIILCDIAEVNVHIFFWFFPRRVGRLHARLQPMQKSNGKNRERKRKKRNRGSNKKLLRLFICEIYVIILGNKWTLRRNQRRTIAEFCFDARPAPHKIRTPVPKLRDSLLVWEIIALSTVFCVYGARAMATTAAAAAHKHLPTSSAKSVVVVVSVAIKIPAR